jgi:hypothetical protein
MINKKEKIKIRKMANWIILGCAVFLMALSGSAQEKLEPLKPLKVENPPVIDGILDDPVWQNAPQETGFKTYHPDFGKDLEEKTVIFYAYDRENLYFAFRCFDSQPEKIKASISRRDSIRPDDWVCVNLDSFNDQQSLYAFYINPLGIQQDSRFEGGEEDFSVDIVWHSAGCIDDKGYAVEIKIPFKSIRFSHKEPVEMSIICERKITRLSEYATYPPLDPAQGANFLTQGRTLVFSGIKHYTLLEVLPGVTYSKRSAIDEGKLTSPGGEGDISLTAKYGITSHLILEGTYNPDFSQVEADAGQVDFNLRYSLFFPEKRPFFLEGKEKFNFGGYHGGDPLSAVVHTRTIVDPIAGVKLNGKIGDKDTIASIYAVDELPEGATEDYAHFSVFRYKRALAQDSFIGGFYTGREREKGFNRVFGLDAQIRINQPSIFGFHAFLSQTKADEEFSREDGHALSLHYLFSNRDMVLMLGLQDIGKNFMTETGYITRTGITRFRSGILRMFHTKSRVIQRIDPMIHSYQIRDKFSGLYETDNTFDLRFILGRSSNILFGYRYATEVFLDEKFSRSGVRINGSSQFTKKLYFSLYYSYGKKIRYISNPYQGKGSDASAGIVFQPSEKLHADLSLVFSDFYRDSDSKKEYDYTIIRSRNTYQVNKYLFFRGIVEYNSFYKRLMTDLLASFTYIPGTVIHIGYGSLYEKIEWIDGEYRTSDSYLETKRGFFFKASFLWRI